MTAPTPSLWLNAMDLYWLDGWEIPSNDILPSLLSGASYTLTQSCNAELTSLIVSLCELSDELKSAIVSDDYQSWVISTSKYIDGVLWIAHQCLLWSYMDICKGFWLCCDMFNWLDAVHTEWIALPLKEIYQLACECYVKTLPTDMIPPPSSTPLPNIPDTPLDISIHLVHWLHLPHMTHIWQRW